MMRTRQEAWLNDQAFTAAHPALLIQNVTENPPKTAQKTVARAGVDGAFLTENRIEKRDIVIEFAVRERLNYAARAQAVERAAAWARNGGWLEIAQRPDLQIWTVLTGFPALGKPSEWNGTIMMILTAYAFPFWIEKIGSRCRSDGPITEADLALSVTGTEPTELEAVIVPATSGLTTVSIAVDEGAPFVLEGLSVTAGSPLRIGVDPYRLLCVESGGVGLLGKRTDTAFNPLTLRSGAHTIHVTTDAAASVTLEARGVFL